MSDFVTGLRAELVAAAERDERRRVPLLPPLRPLLPALAVAALLALAVVVVIARTGDHKEVAKPRATRDLLGGTLDPAVRYRPRGFDPPLELSVTDGRWNAELVEPGTVILSRQSAAGSPNPPIGFIDFTRGGFPVYDPHVRGKQRSLRDAPKDMLGWLRVHPDIRAQPPRATTLAGHPARVMDFEFRFRHPAHAALRCKGMGYQCSALGPGEDAHRNGERDRIWEVRTNAGIVYVLLAGPDAKAFAATERAARPVLAGLKIDD